MAGRWSAPLEQWWPTAGSVTSRRCCFVGRAPLRARRATKAGGVGHGLVAGRPMCADDGARWRMERSSRRGRERGLAPRTKFVVAAVGRPPLRRSSGDVVTADFF
ncbi:hypothetical protein F511_45015 [Dorcoceras hygrometricum]|uniref:Uncharacterized protein n=1 Tax=Dorcoceras hygrometricum TaxID=472368 RepID=A0A2Z7AQ11_9LAMI|nr:hypothetical protein F511_45015 [Dorcoceras hygrometricum]